MTSVTRERLIEEFGALGLPRGASVMVHSSLKSLGWVEGGAEAVVQALIDAVGPEGTVMVPNLPFRGSLANYLKDEPTFYVRTTPSRMGAITEALRKRPDARRSLHSSHSAAVVGRLQEFMTTDHEKCLTTCGEFSPYYKNAHRDDGYILMIGVTLRNMTTFHSIEETEELPYLFSGEVSTSYVIDYDGQCITVRTRGYNEAWPRDFPAPEPRLLKEGLMTVGKVGSAECRLMEAKGTWELVTELVRKDPYVLIAKEKKPKG